MRGWRRKFCRAWRRSRRPSAVRAAAFVAALLVPGVLAGGAAAQTPTYSATTYDAVTGDNTPVVVSAATGSCAAGAECYLPDPNPPAGTPGTSPAWVDNYTYDIYERPTGQGSSANDYYGFIDITDSSVGFDSNWLYYRINIFSTDPSGKLPGYYAFEINYDPDDRGDLLVRVEDPTGKNGVNWGVLGVEAFRDANENMGGPRTLLPDGPASTLGGYESLVFDQGTNYAPGAVGGSTAIRSRIDPTDPTIVELAVRRDFLLSINTTSVLKAAFRPYAAKGSVTQNQFYFHDEYTRGGGGSPYPWLQLDPDPASANVVTTACPTSLAAENALTTTQRDGFDSGTGVPPSPGTALLNPCYPTNSIYEFDNSGTVQHLAFGVDLQFVVDMGVTKTASADPVVTGSDFTYTITATNHNTGSGQATGVTVVDTLPTGTIFVSATPSQGSCTHVTGVVTCDLGTIANEASATVDIVVTSPSSPGVITNTVSVSSDASDPTPANDVHVLDTTVLAPGNIEVVKSVEVVDPDGGGAFAVPGREVIYRIEVTNVGGLVDPGSIVVIDPIPSELALYIGPFDGSTTEPVKFEDGATPSGLTCCSSANIAYSTDGGASYSYLPPAGYDPAITHLRIIPSGSMAAAGASQPSFSIRFRAQIE